MSDRLLELDSRGRGSFAQILGKSAAGKRFLVQTNEDGTLVLTPAVVVSELEAKFLRNPAIMSQIEANRADVTPTVRRADRASSAAPS